MHVGGSYMKIPPPKVPALHPIMLASATLRAVKSDLLTITTERVTPAGERRSAGDRTQGLWAL